MTDLNQWKRQFLSIGMGIFALSTISQTVFATNGMRVIGVGPTQRSMGGAAVGMPLDSATTLTNPAGMAVVAPRVDFGTTMFTPKSSINSISYSTGYGTAQTASKSSNVGQSPMPAFGLILPSSNENLKIGIGGYGVAGMGVDYAGAAIYDKPGYSNYTMMKFSPAVSYKTGDLAVGIAYNIDWATMAFQAAGNQAANSSGKMGSGYTLGALYTMGPLSFGVAYESKQDFDPFKFNSYACPNGYMTSSTTAGSCDARDMSGGTATPTYVEGTLDMDQPPVTTIGVGYTLDKLKIAFDFSQIAWSKTVGKDSPASTYANYSWNMNWSDQTVMKLGVEYGINDDVKLRAGYNNGPDPTDHSRAFETLMFPGIVETHITLGGSFKLADRTILEVGYMTVPESKASGANAAGQGITAYETALSETSVEIGITSLF